MPVTHTWRYLASQMPRLTTPALMILLLPAAVSSCAETPESDSSQPSPAKELQLRTTQLKIGSQTITVECAVTTEEKSRGLMYRKSMPAQTGMLFVFDKPQQAHFWMKNTLIPLSIAYIDAEGTILEVHDMTPLELQPVTSRSYLVSYALEMNQGWFRQHHIGAGDRIEGIPDFGKP